MMRTLPTNPTARELLEFVAGPRHATHSIAKKTHGSVTPIAITCSCGDPPFVVPDILRGSAIRALRNVSP